MTRIAPRFATASKPIGALAALWAFAPASSSLAAEKRFASKEVIRVSVALSSGDLVVEGWEKEEVVVAWKDGDHEPAMVLDAQELRIGSSTAKAPRPPDGEGNDDDTESEGSSWFLFGPGKLRGSSTDVTLHVPVRLQLFVKTVSGDVALTSSRARVRIETVSGDVALKQVQGPLEIETVSGDVRVEEVTGDLSLKSVSGDIGLRAVQAMLVELKTVSGDLKLAKVSARTIRASCQSGDIELEGDVAKDGSVDLKSFSGDTVLLLPAALPLDLEARTHSGTLRVERAMELSEKSDHRIASRIKGEGPRVSLTTFSGSIVVK